MSSLGDLAGMEPLLILAIVAVLAAAAGWMFEREHPRAALMLRRSGYLGMLAAGLLVVGLAATEAKHSDARLLVERQPDLLVSGRETIVSMAPDGHFWVEAQVNGQPVEMLIDTGATVTGLSRPAANQAGITPLADRMPYRVSTANGTILVTEGRAQSLRFGSIAVSNLPVAVPRDFDDDTNVIGMNLLSQLGGWRVEGEKLILTPRQ
ncbi:MAG: TIGR02281 family clan AA aspartic protease [Novosphingobium sp.]